MAMFPQNRVPALHELTAKLLDARPARTHLETLARQLLAMFQEQCALAGLDGVLAEDTDTEPFVAPVTAELEKIDLDGGGPRNAKPKQCVDSLLAGLGITAGQVDERPRITLDEAVRTAALAAITGALESDLAAPQMRHQILLETRGKLEDRHHPSLDKAAKLLDDRAIQLRQTPKIPVDALHAIQRTLVEVRHALLDRLGRSALARAKPIIAAADATAAARLDEPVTLKLTPIDVAVRRAAALRAEPTATAVAQVLLDGVCAVAQLTFRAAERVARPYSPKDTYAVGELVEHVKFGRGTVTASVNQRLEVKFGDTTSTLAQGRK